MQSVRPTPEVSPEPANFAQACEEVARFRDEPEVIFLKNRPKSTGLGSGTVFAEGLGRRCRWPIRSMSVIPGEAAARRKKRTTMPVLAKFYGIVIRMLYDRTFGTHYHAFYGDCELVIGLNPLRVIQGEAPSWVRECALDWVGRYRGGLPAIRNTDGR